MKKIIFLFILLISSFTLFSEEINITNELKLFTEAFYHCRFDEAIIRYQRLSGIQNYIQPAYEMLKDYENAKYGSTKKTKTNLMLLHLADPDYKYLKRDYHPYTEYTNNRIFDVKADFLGINRVFKYLDRNQQYSGYINEKNRWIRWKEKELEAILKKNNEAKTNNSCLKIASQIVNNAFTDMNREKKKELLKQIEKNTNLSCRALYITLSDNIGQCDQNQILIVEKEKEKMEKDIYYSNYLEISNEIENSRVILMNIAKMAFLFSYERRDYIYNTFPSIAYTNKNIKRKNEEKSPRILKPVYSAVTDMLARIPETIDERTNRCAPIQIDFINLFYKK